MSDHPRNHNTGHIGSTESIQSNHTALPTTKAGSGQGARKFLATSNRKGPTRPYPTVP